MKFVLRRMMLVTSLCFSLFLVGSCNERTIFFDFSSAKPDLASLDKGDLIRYAYAIQAGLLNQPEILAELRDEDIQLVLAEPNLNRVEGAARHWQYIDATCVLDIHFMEGKNVDIAHYEMRATQSLSPYSTTDNPEPQQWNCLQNIIQTRRAAFEESLSETYAVLPLNAQRS